MKIKEILRKKGNGIVTIKENEIILKAIQLMNKHNIGSVLVLDDSEKLAGIITERDILRECERCEIIKNTETKQIMSKNLIIGIPDDSIEYSMGVMTKNSIRHLPIIEKGNIAGLISIVDLVKYQLEESQVRNRYLEDYIHNG